MTIVGSIILTAPGAGVIIGFMKGFIRQFALILELVVGLLAVKALYTLLIVKLRPTVTDSMTVAQMLAFVIAWIAIPLISTSAASVLIRTIEAVSSGWLNRLSGVGLGTLKHLLLVSLVVCATQFIGIDSQLISQVGEEESLLYYPMERPVGMFLPAIKGVT